MNTSTPLMMVLLATAAAACDKKASDGKPAGPAVGSAAATGSGATTAAAGGLRIKSSTSSLFISDPGKYFTSVTVDAGSVKAGATIDGVDAAGHRMSFKVTTVKVRKLNPDTGTDSEVDAPELRAGEEGSLDLTLTSGSMSDFGGELFLVDAGAALPADVAAASSAAKAAAEVAAGAAACTLDGAPWPALLASTGGGYYKNGVKMMNGGGKPYFTFSLYAKDKPDTRQLVLAVDRFEAKTGVVDSKTVEALWSGAADGDAKRTALLGYKNVPAYDDASVKLELTRWEAKGADKVVADANLNARLTGVIDTKQTAITLDCKLTDLVVGVWEQSDMTPPGRP